MHQWLERLFAGWSVPLWVVDVVELAIQLTVTVLAFAALRWAAVRALDGLLAPLLRRAAHEEDPNLPRLRTLASLTRSTLTYVLLFLAAVMLLDQVGVSVATILAGAGIAGLAISFGAQRLIRDVLTGFFVLMEDQFRVGEMVTLVLVPGALQMQGMILDMGLRVTRMRDAAGKVITVSNGDIAAVINHSRGPVSATIEVGVPRDIPLERVEEVVGAAPLSGGLFTGSATVEGVAALEAGRTVLRISAPAAPGRALQAELALRHAVAQALQDAGIEIR